MDERPTHLDICSGIGGFSIGFEAEGFRTVAFSEIDPDASLILKHWWPGVPNLGDFTTATDAVLRALGRITAITGGIPCQPASAIGQMRGAEDERWLWPAAIRLVGKVRPLYGVFENPPNLLVLNRGREFNGILSGFSALGYDCWWDVVPAAAIGAGHLRDRLILCIADAQGVGKRGQANEADAIAGSGNPRTQPQCGHPQCSTSNGNSTGLEGHTGNGAHDGGRTEPRGPTAPADLRGRVHSKNWWHEDVSGVPVLVHGLSTRLAEATCRVTGNAIVPQVAQIYARAIYRHLTYAHPS